MTKIYLFRKFSSVADYPCRIEASTTGMIGYRQKFWGLTLKGRISTSLAPLTLSVGRGSSITFKECAVIVEIPYLETRGEKEQKW